MLKKITLATTLALASVGAMAESQRGSSAVDFFARYTTSDSSDMIMAGVGWSHYFTSKFALGVKVFEMYTESGYGTTYNEMTAIGVGPKATFSFAPNSPVSPYVFAGVNVFSSETYSGATSSTSDSSSTQYDIGAGVEFFIGENASTYVELEQLDTISGDEMGSQTNVNGGIKVYF